MIRKQELSCQVGQGADGPGILAGKNITPERFIRGDGIAQPQSRGGPELGNPAQDDEAGKFLRKRDCRDGVHVRREFRIGFIHHHMDVRLLAEGEKLSEFGNSHGSGGGIVGIAQNEHPEGGRFFHAPDELPGIRTEIIFLRKGEIIRNTAHKPKLSFIFGIGRGNQQRPFGRQGADACGNQLRGAVAAQHMCRICLRVGGNRPPQSRILPVRVGGEHVQAGCQIFLQPGRESQGIDVGAKSGDFFFWNAVKLFDFFQVTSMKRCCCH